MSIQTILAWSLFLSKNKNETTGLFIAVTSSNRRSRKGIIRRFDIVHYYFKLRNYATSHRHKFRPGRAGTCPTVTLVPGRTWDPRKHVQHNNNNHKPYYAIFHARSGRFLLLICTVNCNAEKMSLAVLLIYDWLAGTTAQQVAAMALTFLCVTPWAVG